jgi:hypothetical protein
MQFTLLPNEVKRLNEWGHRNCPGCLTYKFTPTGIGDVIEVSCPCGETVDLTDYASW